MSSRPRTWWHWLSNNISKDGITKDLEAMKEIGLKGAQVFGMPQGHPFGDVDYLTPEWMEMSEHAAKESARLGLDLGFSNAIGCSGAGGPWITPELSMQKLVWTETRVTGPFKGELTLPQPFASASIKVSGRDDDGVFGAASMVLDAIHNDPNGEADLVAGGYTANTNGAGQHYSWKNWQPRWEADGPGTGWLLTCHP